MSIYLRAGTTVDGLQLTNSGGTSSFDTTKNLTVTIEGGDCKALNVSFTSAILSFSVEASKDAIPFFIV